MSVSTLTSATHGLRDLFGRGMNLISDLYKLPADKQELDRLTLQHKIWRLMVDGLYPKEAEEAVQELVRRCEKEERRMKILDIGSGSGSWALEMAQKFPNSEVLGIDLIEHKSLTGAPNCSFVRADATTCLHRYIGQFDIVQCRSVAKHVLNPAIFTRDIGHTLRPGGIFFFADATADILNKEKQIYPHASDHVLDPTVPLLQENKDGSWFARWLWEVNKRWTTKARMNTDGDKLHLLLRADQQFVNIHDYSYYSPIGWDGGDYVEGTNGSEVGNLMVLNVFDFLQASVPSLLASGMSEETVTIWTKNCRKEVLDPSKKLLLKWVIAWATKS
ncbi:S-adenosyl-L-methionine-dependent methyltransferase [Pyrrhoderma noxium]|uniref:S-adenosyl-L-methionine-dependent methyltransferase n=1 Tax=Pyrrhoderma noxium TaxID=2282107 RepID=A0A286UM53_9AGAM|nr:S-adenosyl-L-methionine-dependent methyltransferase [Pyrrhoderma noxium]